MPMHWSSPVGGWAQVSGLLAFVHSQDAVDQSGVRGIALRGIRDALLCCVREYLQDTCPVSHAQEQYISRTL